MKIKIKFSETFIQRYALTHGVFYSLIGLLAMLNNLDDVENLAYKAISTLTGPIAEIVAVFFRSRISTVVSLLSHAYWGSLIGYITSGLFESSTSDGWIVFAYMMIFTVSLVEFLGVWLMAQWWFDLSRSRARKRAV